MIFAMEPVSARLLEHARALKIVARPGVGYYTVDLVAATRCGVAVTTYHPRRKGRVDAVRMARSTTNNLSSGACVARQSTCSVL